MTRGDATLPARMEVLPISSGGHRKYVLLCPDSCIIHTHQFVLFTMSQYRIQRHVKCHLKPSLSACWWNRLFAACGVPDGFVTTLQVWSMCYLSVEAVCMVLMQ